MRETEPPILLVSTAMAGLVITGLLAFVATTAADDRDGIAAVLLPPWWSERQALAAAAEAGAIVGTGGLPFVVFVPNQPKNHHTLKGEWLRLKLPSSVSCFAEGSAT